MRSTRWFAAIALVLAALAVLFAAPAASAHDNGKGKTLRLFAEELQFEELDLGTAGPSLGDEFVFSQSLWFRGRDVGMSGGVCTVVHAVPPYDVLTFQCLVTLDLERGQITLQGLIELQGEEDPGPFTLAITGGTGKFSGASGTARFRSDERATGVYRLRFDKGKKHHNGHHNHNGHHKR